MDAHTHQSVAVTVHAEQTTLTRAPRVALAAYAAVGVTAHVVLLVAGGALYVIGTLLEVVGPAIKLAGHEAIALAKGRE